MLKTDRIPRWLGDILYPRERYERIPNAPHATESDETPPMNSEHQVNGHRDRTDDCRDSGQLEMRLP